MFWIDFGKFLIEHQEILSQDIKGLNSEVEIARKRVSV